MTVRQLSVFLENKSGRLNEVLSVLASAKINITALTIADTTEYGILRMIVSDPSASLARLREKGFSANLSEVIALELVTASGSLSKILDCFSSRDISIEYLYAFSFGSKAVAVLRMDNRERALEIIAEDGLKLITEEDLK